MAKRRVVQALARSLLTGESAHWSLGLFALMVDLEELESQALAMIRQAGFSASRRVGLGGRIVDIAIAAKDHESGPITIGIETRNWRPEDRQEAMAHAARERELLEAQLPSSTFRVLVAGSGSAPEPMITIDDLQRLLGRLSPTRRSRSALGSRTTHPIVFCAMPFHEDFLDIYLLAIVPAMSQLGYDVNRLDQTHSFTGIDRRIRDGIRDARFVLADISGRNPNVMYEVGLAHGLGVNTFLLRDSDTDIPFDIRDQMVLEYNRMKIHDLAVTLPTRIVQVVSEQSK